MHCWAWHLVRKIIIVSVLTKTQEVIPQLQRTKQLKIQVWMMLKKRAMGMNRREVLPKLVRFFNDADCFKNKSVKASKYKTLTNKA